SSQQLFSDSGLTKQQVLDDLFDLPVLVKKQTVEEQQIVKKEQTVKEQQIVEEQQIVKEEQEEQ
ncbi:10158_t:CDS:1, partial [Cetraspora pellucida]